MSYNYRNPEEIKNIWSNHPVFIIGGGLSVFDFPLVVSESKFKSIGVNNAAFDFNTDALWFSDDRWAYEWNSIELQKYPGIIAGCPHTPFSTMYWYKRSKPVGIETKGDSIAWNNNSGGGAINFAYHLGCKTIGLVGFDMKKGAKGEHNYHRQHKVNLRRYNPFPLMKQSFLIIAKEIESLGVEVYNLNIDSDLMAFPKISSVDFISRFK